MSESTSNIAGRQAALKAGGWRLKILDRLRQAPSALWELAQHFGVPDHTISGRLTELARDQWIERTGERRNKPVSGCPADVWRVRGTVVPGLTTSFVELDLVREMGYPDTIVIEGEPYDRQGLLESEGLPAIPYARRTDMGGLRLLVRVQLVECPRCGRPMFQTVHGGDKKSYHCGNRNCTRWRLRLVKEAGRALMLALVMED